MIKLIIININLNHKNHKITNTKITNMRIKNTQNKKKP